VTAPEPSREDRYEAAVRAVLDLCDRAEADLEVPMFSEAVPVLEIRAAIRGALESPSALADGQAEDRAPVSISGPGAASERLSVPELVLGPEASGEAWAAHGGEPHIIAQMRLAAVRRDQQGGRR
jgi:hypothetical protein